MKYKFIIFIKLSLKIILYFFSSYKRYANLIIIIFKLKPKIILEIGVYKGARSIEMIQAAKLFNNNVKYYGFDLFEDFFKKKNILKNEFSKKPENLNFIKNKLNKFCDVKLYKGYTKKTLPVFLRKKIKPDLVFIDGGHSVKTIKSDWNFIRKIIHNKTIVIFDDYYSNANNIVNKFGCNKIINNLGTNYKYRILPLTDEILFGGKKILLNFVEVSNIVKT